MASTILYAQININKPYKYMTNATVATVIFCTCKWEESNWTPRLMNQVTCDCKKVLGPSFHSAELLPTLLWAMLKITAFVWRCLKIWHPPTNLKQLNTGKQLNRNEEGLQSLPKSVQKTWLSSVSMYCKHRKAQQLSIAKACAHSVSMALTIIWLGSPKLHSLPKKYCSAKEHGKTY